MCLQSPGYFYSQIEEGQKEGEASSRLSIQDKELFNFILIRCGPDVGPLPITLHIMLYENALFPWTVSGVV